MRIIKLKAENVKRIKAVEITPTGDIVQVTGRNGQGKTSILDSILWALGGAKSVQARPIRKGKRQASVELDLGKYLVTRRWTQSGSYLHVAKRGTESTGTVEKPQQILDGLLSKVAFDPLSFMRLKAPQQAELLRSVVGLDISKIDSQKADLSEQRRELGRSISTIPPECGADPGPERSVSDAVEKLEAARDEKEKHEAAIRDHADALWKARTAVANCAEAESEAKRLAEALLDAKSALKSRQRERDQTRSAAESAKRLADAMPRPTNIAELSEGVTKASDHNRLALAHKDQVAIVEADQKRRTERDALTRRIEQCSEKKQSMIQAVKMPVEGLSFDDYGEIYFGGFPLDQASSAEKLRISMEIAMAAQPELRIIRITDGSLLDSESLEAIRAVAADGDYQVWIESVDETGKVGVVIEDGEVVADNQAASE